MASVNLDTTTTINATAYPQDRHLLKTSDGILVFIGGHNGDLQYKQSSDDGITWSAWITIIASADLTMGCDAILDSSNNIYVVIRANAGVYLKKLTYNAGLHTFSIGTTREPYITTQMFSPTIIVRPSGELFVTAFYGNSGTWRFYASYSTDDGATWTRSYVTEPSELSVAVWACIQGSTIWGFETYATSIVLRVWDDTGKAWGAATTIASGIGLNGEYDRISGLRISDSDIYIGSRTTSGNKVWHYNGSTWDSGTLLSNNTNDKTPSFCNIGAIPTAVWEDYDGINYNIMYRQFKSSVWTTQQALSSGNTDHFPSEIIVDATKLYFCYTEGSSSPYSIYFDILNFVTTTVQTIGSDTNIRGIVIHTTTVDTYIINAELQKVILSVANIIKSGIHSITSIAHIQKVGAQQIIPSDASISYGHFEPAIISDSVILKRSLLTLDSVANITTAYHSKFINGTSLFITTHTSPITIIKAEIAPAITTWVIYSIGTELDNATNLVLNFFTLNVYTTSEEGYVIKSPFNAPSSTTNLYVGELVALDAIAHLPDYRYTYVSAMTSIGELFMIDETTDIIVKTDLRFFKILSKVFKNFLSFLKGITINADLRFLAILQTFISTDLRFLKMGYTAVEPLPRSTFVVKINGVQNDFVKLDSININITVDTQITATFKMARYHDRLDYDLNGDYEQITDKNDVEIWISNVFVFSGKVSTIKANSETEDVEITAEGDYPDLPPAVLNNPHSPVTSSIIMDKGIKNLPITTLNNKLGFYDILLNDIQIDNPDIDPNDINPKYFNGIKAQLGNWEIESVYREDAKFITGNAEDFENFVPEPNYEYFWYASGINFIDGFSFNFKYIGTSLAPLSNDTFDIQSFSYKKQRRFANIIRSGYIATSLSTVTIGFGTKTFRTQYGLAYAPGIGVRITSALNDADYLIGSVVSYDGINLVIGVSSFGGSGNKNSWNITPVDIDESYYHIGTAPFKEISVKNGIYIAESYWEDREDGLYEAVGISFDFIPYVKRVVRLEYQKMCNINGTVLPITTANLSLMLDAYLYYNLKLLNRINIINTIQSDIYKNNNGFPLSIKSITIDSQTMSVNLVCDNQWSRAELDLLDASLPPEPHQYSFIPFKIEDKFDLNVKEDIS